MKPPIATVMLMALTLLCAGCASFPESTPSAELFPGFRILPIPRSQLEVGAQWVQGMGPVGHGVDGALLKTDPSFSTLNTESDFGAQVAASLAGKLGLTGEVRRSSRLALHDVKIVTIRDFGKAGLRPNATYIYEAIRVGRISIASSSDTTTEVSAAAIREFGAANVTAGSSGSNSIDINAGDLFVAYRVATFGKPSVKRIRKQVDGPRVYELGNYEVRVNPATIDECMCTNTDGTRLKLMEEKRHAQYASCAKEHAQDAVLVRNSEQVTMGARGDAFLYRALPDGQGQGPIFVQYDTDKVRFDYLAMQFVQSDTAQKFCLPSWWKDYYDKQFSFLELSSMTYPLKTLDSPQAPGW